MNVQEVPLTHMLVSIIIPVYNEVENLNPLYDRIVEALAECDFEFEVLLADDGSTDGSDGVLKDLALRDPRFKVIEFRRNYGQTAAMMAAIDYSSGEIIVGLDADLQNDPTDIPRLVEALGDDFDVCSGWRADRQDKALTRKLPSFLANRLISRMTGVRLHDYGCTLKAYRRESLEGVRLYGEMHRFIPICASWRGARVTELKVNHHARERGESKYGLGRTIKVVLDLIVITAYLTLLNKPGYIFGGFGLLNLCGAGVGLVTMVSLKVWGDKSFIDTPLPSVVVMFSLVGVMSILMGFLAEIMMRTYYESQGRTVYAVRNTRNLPEEDSSSKD